MSGRSDMMAGFAFDSEALLLFTGYFQIKNEALDNRGWAGCTTKQIVGHCISSMPILSIFVSVKNTNLTEKSFDRIKK